MTNRQRHKGNPGRFTQLLTITASSGSRGDGGDFQPAWNGASTQVRGMWRKTSYTENAMEGGRFSRASGVWEIPWIPSLAEDFRVSYTDRNGTTQYQRIVGIDDQEKRGRELHLYVVEDEGANT
jgi:hypothetical protein